MSTHTWPQIVNKSPHNMKTINKLAEVQVQQPVASILTHSQSDVEVPHFSKI